LKSGGSEDNEGLLREI